MGALSCQADPACALRAPQVGDKVLLTYKGEELAVMTVESKYMPNKVEEAKHCYGTTSIEHPAVRMITMERGPIYLGGKVQGLKLPTRIFSACCLSEGR